MQTKDSLDFFLDQIDHAIHSIKIEISHTMGFPSSSINFLLSGKKLRSRLVFHSHLLSSFDDKLSLGVLLELIHSASLVHDDIVDESTLRRGFSTLQEQFVLTKAISTGYKMFSMIFKRCDALTLNWRNCFYLTLHQMCLGEIWELEDINNSTRSISQYKKSIIFKTASLFGLCCGLEDADQWNSVSANFGLLFGFAFQLYDDLLDIYSNSHITGKTSHKDASLGILTLPEMLCSYYHSSEKAITKCKTIGLLYLEKAKRYSENYAWRSESEKLAKLYLDL
jgi:geranylgeranyl pyrophosphate synthase